MSIRRGVGLFFQFRQGFVVAVNVCEKVDLPVFFHHGAGVNNQHGNCAGEIYLRFLSGLECFLDSPFCPTRIVSQDPHRQRLGILNADASVAEITPRSAEQ